MKRRITSTWGVLCVLCVLLCASGAARAQTEQILAYHSDIQLSGEGTLTVQETIRVVSAGEQIRHGIYRDFPTRYKDRLGNQYAVGFDLMGATCDGAPEETRIENRSNGVRIYLGSPKYYVAPGEHTYTITYTTDRQLGFFSDHDELFWNVTGNGWIFPIERASATVHLPEKIPANEVRLGGYTGPQGSMEQELTYSAGPDNTFDFEATRPLGSYEGLTILLIWPKGLIQAPTTQRKLAYFLHDNSDAAIGAGGLGVIFLYYLMVWAAVGRDPKHGTIVALYEPPTGFSPAAMRYLERLGYDDKAFACAIVDMAVKGYLKIEQPDETYSLRRLKTDTSNLTAEEKAVANILFEGRDDIWLHNENHTTISAAIAALKKWLKTAELKVYFVTNSVYMIPAAVISLALILWMAGAHGTPALAIVGFMGVWLTGWSAAVAALVITSAQAWKASFEGGGDFAGGLAGKAMVTTLIAIPFAGFEVMALWMLSSATSIFIALTLIGAVALHIVFHFLLKAPTRAGRTVLDKIDGFKMFLGAVEGDQIRRAMEPQKTPEVFEKYLPYAIALGVEKAWAEKFSGVVNRAGQAPGSSDGYSPAWYSGPGWSNFGAAGFASSLSSSFSSAISSSSAAPGSSGGGSGGSGGGGGGGGGGGW